MNKLEKNIKKTTQTVSKSKEIIPDTITLELEPIQKKNKNTQERKNAIFNLKVEHIKTLDKIAKRTDKSRNEVVNEIFDKILHML